MPLLWVKNRPERLLKDMLAAMPYFDDDDLFDVR